MMWTAAVIGDGVDKTSDTRKKRFGLENTGHTPSRLNFFLKAENGDNLRARQATAT